MFWEDLEYFHYINYELAIRSWEDMKEKFCQEYLSPYFRAKYLPQSQCSTFQMKQMKTQTDSIGKPRIIGHNEIIVAPIEDNIMMISW